MGVDLPPRGGLCRALDWVARTGWIGVVERRGLMKGRVDEADGRWQALTGDSTMICGRGTQWGLVERIEGYAGARFHPNRAISSRGLPARAGVAAKQDH